MRLSLAGLRIVCVEAGDDDPGDRDVLWRVCRVATLPFDPEVVAAHSALRSIPADDGGGIDYLFGYGHEVRCHFRIAADGMVTSWVGPGLSEHDLLGLFSEAILRIVLLQLRFPSFHAAALMRHGRAVLIAGEKGAGKSTLSATLERHGWTLLADDLVRVVRTDRWCAYPGARQGKLRRDTAAALGLQPQVMPRRWRECPADAEHENKWLLPEPTALDAPLAAVPIDAILLLGPRHDGQAPLVARLAPPLARVQGLSRHATPDPLNPGRRPAGFVRDAIGGLAREVRIFDTALVNGFGRLDEIPGAIAALLANTLPAQAN